MAGKKISSKETKSKERSRGLDVAIIVALIALMGTCITALSGSPILEKLLFPPESTATLTFANVPSNTPTSLKTVRPILPTETVTQTFTPIFVNTVTFTPTSTITITLTPTPIVVYDHKVPMVLVPAGFFLMQSSQGMSRVFVNDYYIDQHEVTNSQYEECVNARGCTRPFTDTARQYQNVRHFGDTHYGNFPVVLVSWNMAESYCRWRDKDTRLPTDIEWEKAARGSLEDEAYPWGNGLPTCSIGHLNGANFSQCGSNDAFPIMQFSPNSYGIFDMSGNVSEWVNNTVLGPTGAERMLRGGSWLSDAMHVAVYSYINKGSINGFVDAGFRCARNITP